jgi:hypothetical protein
LFERAADGHFDVAQVERLRHIVERPGAQRLDGVLNRLRAADHDDHGFGRDLGHVRNHLQTAHALHVDVADHHVEAHRAQTPQRGLRRSHQVAIVIFAQQFVENAANLLLVVGDQNAGALPARWKHRDTSAFVLKDA